MDESFLKWCALIIIGVGLSSLAIVVFFSETEALSSLDVIPLNQEVSFEAQISSEYASKNGMVFELSRQERITAFLDKQVNESFLDRDCLVSGSYDGEWFTVSSLECE